MLDVETVKFQITKNPYTGADLPTPINVSFDFSGYENKPEIPAGELLTDEQYTKAVNARRKAAIRAKETTSALKEAGIKKPDQNSQEVMEANQIKLFMKMYEVNEPTAKQALEAQKKLIAAMKTA